MKIKSFLFLSLVLGIFSSHAMEKGNTLSEKEEELFKIVNKVEAGPKDIERVRELLKENVDGSFALNWAAYKGNKEIVQMLLDVGVDVNSQCKPGHTPLVDAVLHDHEDIVEILLAHGADINETALTWAMRSSNNDIVQMLLDHGAKFPIKKLKNAHLFLRDVEYPKPKVLPLKLITIIKLLNRGKGSKEIYERTSIDIEDKDIKDLRKSNDLLGIIKHKDQMIKMVIHVYRRCDVIKIIVYVAPENEEFVKQVRVNLRK